MNYGLTCINNSTNVGSFVFFQKMPQPAAETFSLAWFAHIAAPTTKINFKWTIDYSFVWSETGVLMPGVQFDTSQNWDADLTGKNRITFTDANGVPTFANLEAGVPGSLQIASDGTVPPNTFSVGIGMGGSAAFAQQAQPNLNWAYTPHPTYWVAFGNYSAGEVLDVESITNVAQITYPPNVYSMTATLNPDNSWTVSQLSKFNEVLAKERQHSLELSR